MSKREIPFGRPTIDEAERAAVQQVLEGHILVHGPKVKEFEQDFTNFTNAPHSLAVASCTAALHLAYLAIGLKEGDEVIVPAQTHIATAHAIEFCGGTCVFVDAELETGNIDIGAIEAAITDRTRAITLVHFLGIPVDMPKVMEIANAHNLKVIEDCALSIGASVDGVHTGLHGHAGCFSFYPVKHITTIEGGMFITRDKEIASDVNRRRAFGVDRVVGERKMPGMYDVDMLGYNYRMNEVEAAIGVEQLKKLPGILETRKANYEILDKSLREVDEISLFSIPASKMQCSYYCCSALLKEELISKKTEIVNKLKEEGVGSSVYYPQAVPLMSYYQDKYKHSATDFPVADYISRASISLPVGPHLNGEDMEYVSKVFKSVLSAV